MTLGFCNIINESDVRCESKYQLYAIIFVDPNRLSDIEVVNVCKNHYQVIIKEINDELNKLQLEIKNLVFTDKNQRKIAKENDVIYQIGPLQYNLEYKKELFKKISLDQCRNYFCKRNLKTLAFGTKVYSVTTISPYGKRQNTFYLCSFSCFRRIKGIFGIVSPLLKKQFTLETY